MAYQHHLQYVHANQFISAVKRFGHICNVECRQEVMDIYPANVYPDNTNGHLAESATTFSYLSFWVANEKFPPVKLTVSYESISIERLDQQTFKWERIVGENSMDYCPYINAGSQPLEMYIDWFVTNMCIIQGLPLPAKRFHVSAFDTK